MTVVAGGFMFSRTFVPCLVNTLSKKKNHIKAISLNLAQTFTWTPGWKGQNCVIMTLYICKFRDEMQCDIIIFWSLFSTTALEQELDWCVGAYNPDAVILLFITARRSFRRWWFDLRDAPAGCAVGVPCLWLTAGSLPQRVLRFPPKLSQIWSLLAPKWQDGSGC